MPKKDQKNNGSFIRLDLILLTILVIIGFGLRMYKIDNLVADWHSWRQADTAAVARNFTRTGFDLLHPRFDDLGSNQSGFDNPQGYRFVEFPFYSAIFAGIYKAAPIMPVEMYGRATSAVFSLFTLCVIYYLLLKEENRIAAFIGGLLYAILPFVVYYSRVILPEPTATSLAFLSIFFMYIATSVFTQDKQKNIRYWVYTALSCVFFALALLTKPTTIFYSLVLLYLLCRTHRFKVITTIHVYVFFVMAFIPFAAWRMWIAQFPEGIPASSWLITSVNTFEGQKNIFFKPAFFRWMFYERIANLILGGYGTILLFLGIVKKPKKSLLLTFIGIAALAYLFTFQGGNVQHDYYQTILLPAIAIFAGVGGSFLFEEKKPYRNTFITVLGVALVIGFTFLFSYYKVKDFYWTDPDLIASAKVINTVTPQGAKIITDRDGDTTLLYLADRKGYAATVSDLATLKTKGMEYFVTLKKEVADAVKKETDYDIVFESEKVYIFKL